MKKISRLLKVNGMQKDENLDYAGGEIDEASEQYGEEFEHKEWCNFIYGNCDCGMESGFDAESGDWL